MGSLVAWLCTTNSTPPTHPCCPCPPPSPLQVWDENSRGQVLQVEPFRPWEEQAAQDCGLSGTPTMQVGWQCRAEVQCAELP